MTPDLLALWITLRLALIATGVLLLLGIPLAWWLARTRSPLKTVVESIVALPLVLPPTVLGFYLLIAFSPQGIIGESWQALGGGRLAFTFTGLVIGSVIYSLPFVVQPLQNAFMGVGPALMEAAATLRAGPLDRFFTIALPMARTGLVTAATLGFAHTVGEFGVVLMIGGNIPGETQVLSIAIYDHVESLEYAQAHLLSMGLLCFSFLLLFAIYLVNSKKRRST
uniref:Molybdenum transport system permease n=1 Tax=Candidatus Kentrum sp. MB TaxID=2138164 RepID=A0A451B723_9GAMM|nr:MAG: molybdate transport system permease protein [Candidatus Kentron sp. MB]VFK28796.1 MAG: molybdate transport system permease protein [Candidatus Kentron sp. MB]VFK74100.1 MAG: molybdate transport system permease protein [Candidatus Kentron sp. MB]